MNDLFETESSLKKKNFETGVSNVKCVNVKCLPLKSKLRKKIPFGNTPCPGTLGMSQPCGILSRKVAEYGLRLQMNHV